MKSLPDLTYGWVFDWIKSKYGIWILFLLVFIDGSIFPFPTTLIYITVSLINQTKSYLIALIATIAMGMGGILGYCIGHFLWLTPGGGYTAIANFFYNHIPGFDVYLYRYLHQLYNQYSFTILFSAIFLPIPYQIYSITAGALNINIFVFIISTFIFQGARFFGLAFLITKFGERVKRVLNKHVKLISAIILMILLAYIFVLFFTKNK